MNGTIQIKEQEVLQIFSVDILNYDFGIIVVKCLKVEGNTHILKRIGRKAISKNKNNYIRYYVLGLDFFFDKFRELKLLLCDLVLLALNIEKNCDVFLNAFDTKPSSSYSNTSAHFKDF